MLTKIPENALRFVSGKNTGFTTVTYSGSTTNGTSHLTVTFYDSTSTPIYTFSKGNPRDVPVIPLDKQQEDGVETVLDVSAADPYASTVSPTVMRARPKYPRCRATAGVCAVRVCARSAVLRSGSDDGCARARHVSTSPQ